MRLSSAANYSEQPDEDGARIRRQHCLWRGRSWPDLHIGTVAPSGPAVSFSFDAPLQRAGSQRAEPSDGEALGQVVSLALPVATNAFRGTKVARESRAYTSTVSSRHKGGGLLRETR